MTESFAHLTEDERQMLADGTIAPDQAADATAHLAQCAKCADDVARIGGLMTRARTPSDSGDSLDELWPAIRSRIEAQKVVALAPVAADASAARGRGTLLRRWTGVAAMAAAAAVVTAIVVRGHGQTSIDFARGRRADTVVALVAAVDSARLYEEEAQALLDRLEVQRAVLRPEAARLLDRDLRSIDVAIAELKDAIGRDPNNPTLRQLLASSYRQKVDLLKRANNAG